MCPMVYWMNRLSVRRSVYHSEQLSARHMVSEMVYRKEHLSVYHRVCHWKQRIGETRYFRMKHVIERDARVHRGAMAQCKIWSARTMHLFTNASYVLIIFLIFWYQSTHESPLDKRNATE
eukprot:m.32930 g.32930  ORF g.32930 m.32930 type:complete len:120 (+) comp14169_c0_seq1:187-546(+)